MTERNALAELAEDLDSFWTLERQHRDSVVDRAQRIIAELAKVSDGEWENICDGPPAYICNAGDLKVQCAIGRCCAIAEEGTGK